MNTIREAAFNLYTAPFRYDTGYIWDSKDEMVADQGGIDELEKIMRVRGWGRIQYLKNFKPEQLQDQVGKLCAEALTNLWNRHNRKFKNDGLAKYMADEIGHGMSEKCERYAEIATEYFNKENLRKIELFIKQSYSVLTTMHQSMYLMTIIKFPKFYMTKDGLISKTKDSDDYEPVFCSEEIAKNLLSDDVYGEL